MGKLTICLGMAHQLPLEVVLQHLEREAVRELLCPSPQQSVVPTRWDSKPIPVTSAFSCHRLCHCAEGA